MINAAAAMTQITAGTMDIAAAAERVDGGGHRKIMVAAAEHVLLYINILI